MCLRLSVVLTAVACLLLLTGCDDSNEPFANEREYQLTVQPDGSALERWRLWGVGAKSAETGVMQTVVEKLVKEYEPFVFQRTPSNKDSNTFVMRREIIIRGDALDCFTELEYPEGIGQTIFRHLQTNGLYCVGLDNDDVETRHNGETQVWLDDTNVVTLAVWPTNVTYIWFRQTQTNQTSVPVAWLYKWYLDTNRTFPWQTNQ